MCILNQLYSVWQNLKEQTKCVQISLLLWLITKRTKCNYQQPQKRMLAMWSKNITRKKCTHSLCIPYDFFPALLAEKITLLWPSSVFIAEIIRVKMNWWRWHLALFAIGSCLFSPKVSAFHFIQKIYLSDFDFLFCIRMWVFVANEIYIYNVIFKCFEW